MPVTPRYMEPSAPRRRRSRRSRKTTFRGPPRRRRRAPLLPLLAGLAVVAAIVLGAVGLMSLLGEDESKQEVERFARAWQRGAYAEMYGRLDAASRRDVSRPAFERAYRRAAATAGVASLRAGEPEGDGDGWRVPVTVRTRSFRVLRGDVRVRAQGDPPRIAWRRELVFPGLRPGERLRRRSRAPRRAALLARDGRLLASSDGTQTELGAQTGITGELGLAGAARRRALAAAGFPADALVGESGLQRVLDARLRGTAGGTLLAGRRVLARTAPRPARAVRSSIDPALTRAAQSALGGQFGGVAVVEPATGEVLGLGGIALDGAQPPGSTLKIVTVTAALEDRKVTMRSRFPVQTGANAGGRYIPNAHNEACGGDLTESFSKSCNSVFAPLGVKVGARRLVRMAERFGFNEPTGVPGAKAPSIPRRMSSVETGESAIGQGRTLATPLNMAVIGATIANRGRRARLTLLHGGRPRLVPVTTPGVAEQVRRLMVAVVNGAGATGTAAALPGVRVAGKTGTAELGGGQPNDAWFVAFAPAQRPRLAVGVLVVHGGFGGDTAAPIARQVLEAGL